MKILHLICTIGIAGAEKHLGYLLPGMAAYNYECHLIIVHPAAAADVFSDFATTLNSKGVKTTLLNTEKPISFSTVKKIKLYLNQNKINVIHSHLLRSDFLAVLIKKIFLKNIKVISTKHGYEESVSVDYDPENYKQPSNLHYYLTKYCLRNIDHNISVSNYMSQLFINFNLTKTYYEVIYHGVNVDFEDSGIELFKDEGLKLVIVGRLEPCKGHKFVIEAMKLVLEKIGDAQLFVVGSGTIEEELKQLAQDQGASKSIKFLGFKPNALEYIKQADLLVIPSLVESFGLVFIESLGLGKCIIAFDVPAGNEILSNSTAQLIPKGDVNALADRIISLGTNPNKRIEIEKNALKSYNSKFTTSIMTKNTAEYYDSIKLGL